jgi:hypothetical protein
MRRRDFITLLGGAGAWPLAGRAQPSGAMPRIGVMIGGAESDPEFPPRATAFERGLAEAGWLPGRNVQIVSRWAAAEPARMEALAKELVELRPDVILASTTPVVASLVRETRTIPIVFVAVSDPVGSGFVASLPRPGGNITGFIHIESSLGSKWVELLKQLAPHITRIAAMFNPETAPQAGYYVGPFEAAAPTLGVAPITRPVRHGADIEQAIGDLAQGPPGGRHSGGEPRLEPAAPFGIDAVADRGRAARSALLLLVLALPLALILVFARLLVFFADRFLRVEAPIRKSSRVAPFLSFPAIHFGMAPRPAQVLAGLSGSRYFGGILPPLRLARVAVLPVIPSR